MIESTKSASYPAINFVVKNENYCERSLSVSKVSSSILSQLSNHGKAHPFPLQEIRALDAERMFALAFCRFHKEKCEVSRLALSHLHFFKSELSSTEGYNREFCEATALLLFFYDRGELIGLAQNQSPLTLIAQLKERFDAFAIGEINSIKKTVEEHTPYILHEAKKEAAVRRAQFLAKMLLTKEGYVNNGLIARLKAILIQEEFSDQEIAALLSAFEYGCCSEAEFQLEKEVAAIDLPCEKALLLAESIKASLSMNSEWMLSSRNCKEAAIASLFLVEEHQLPPSLLTTPLLAERMARYLQQLSYFMREGGARISEQQIEFSTRPMLEKCDIEVVLSPDGEVFRERSSLFGRVLRNPRSHKLCAIPNIEAAYRRMGVIDSQLMDRMVAKRIVGNQKKKIAISSIIRVTADILAIHDEGRRNALYIKGVLTFLTHCYSPLYMAWQKHLSDIEKLCPTAARDQRIERVVEALLHKSTKSAEERQRVAEISRLWNKAFREANTTVEGTAESFFELQYIPLLKEIKGQLMARAAENSEEVEEVNALFSLLESSGFENNSTVASSSESSETAKKWLSHYLPLTCDTRPESSPFYDAFFDRELFPRKKLPSTENGVDFAIKWGVIEKSGGRYSCRDRFVASVENDLVNPGLAVANNAIDKELSHRFIEIVKIEFAHLVNGQQFDQLLNDKQIVQQSSSLRDFFWNLREALYSSLRRGQRESKNLSLLFTNLAIKWVILENHRQAILGNAIPVIPANRTIGETEEFSVVLFFNPLELAPVLGITDGTQLELFEWRE